LVFLLGNEEGTGNFLDTQLIFFFFFR